MPLPVRLFFLTSLRYFRRNRVRSLLTLLGIISGVTVFIFAPSLAISISASFDEAANELGGQAQIEVQGDSSGFDAAILPDIRATEGVDQAIALAMLGVFNLDEGEPLTLLGIDMQNEQEIRDYHLVAGEFLTAPEQMMITETYATDKNLTIGDSMRLISEGGVRNLTIVGILEAKGIARINSGEIVFTSLDDVYALRGAEKISSVSIMTTSNVPQLIDKLNQVLPEGVEATLPQARSEQVVQIQTFLNLMMGANAVVMLITGSTLVTDTMAVTVVQRRKEIGLLRSLGVTPRTIRSLFIVEAAIIGLIGSAIGIILGILVLKFAGTLPVIPVSGDNIPTTAPEIRVPLWLIPLALLSGIIVSMIAAYLPARSASQVDVLTALTALKESDEKLGISRRRIIIGVVIIIAALSTVPLFHATGNIFLPTLGALSLFGSSIVLLPLIVIAANHILPKLMQTIFGAQGFVAAKNLQKRPRRVLLTICILMLGAWSMVVVASSNTGFQNFTDDWLAAEGAWDMIVAGAGSNPFQPMISLPYNVLSDFSNRDDIETAIPERLTNITYEGTEYALRAVDSPSFFAAGGRFVWDTGDEEQAYQRLQDTENPVVLITGVIAAIDGVKIGDTISLTTPNGPLDVEVVGIVVSAVEPARAGEGSFVMDLTVYQQYWNDTAIDRLLINLVDTADKAAFRREIQTRYAIQGVTVYDVQDLSATLTESLASLVTVSQILTTIFVVILLTGVTNALFIFVLDRFREIGMLRAIGFDGTQITISILLEVSLLLGIAIVLAVPLGLFNNYSNSITMQRFLGVDMAVRISEVLVFLAILIIGVLSAAFLPARYAAQVEVLDTLKYE